MTYHKFNNTYENYINNSLLSQMKNSINIIENFSSSIKIQSDIPYYYINLDERSDRKQHIEDIAKKFDIKNITRIPAISIKSLDDVIKYKGIIDTNSYNMLVKQNITRNRLHHSDLTNGSVGCFLSHLQCYKNIVNNNIY